MSHLDKLEEPASLIELRDQTAALLPQVDVAELLLDMQAKTGLADEFTHVSEAEARAEDLSTSVCAVLLSEACNIGLRAVEHRDHPALVRGRLNWVQQSYIRAETLMRANARLVDYQATLALAKNGAVETWLLPMDCGLSRPCAPSTPAPIASTMGLIAG